jgi:membrane fusion protein, multidrug efflux system
MPDSKLDAKLDTNTTWAPSVAAAPKGNQPPEADEPQAKSHTWLWVLIILAIGGIGYFLYHQREAMEKTENARAGMRPPSVPVVTDVAKKGDIGVYVQALGTVTPVATVSVTSRVQGQIMNVHYTEGQMVHKGDSLLEIDPRPYQAAVDQMQGQLAHDQAVLSEARIDLTRYQEAFARNAIAKQQMDDQEQAVHQDEGTVQNDQGQLDNAKVNLVYTHITSPIDGRVGLRLVDNGNLVQANGTNPLVVVTQLQPITVIFSVAEDYLPSIEKQLRAGQRLEVDAFDRTQATKIASGYLLTVDNQIDPTTGTVKLRANFPNTDSALFPNQFVNARLLVDTQHGATLVPTPAIQRNAQGAFIYVVKPDQTASVQNVTVGTANGDVTAVTGIQPGDVIVVNGFDKMEDGIKVTTSAGGSRGAAAGSTGGNASGASAGGTSAPAGTK